MMESRKDYTHGGKKPSSPAAARLVRILGEEGTTRVWASLVSKRESGGGDRD